LVTAIANPWSRLDAPLSCCLHVVGAEMAEIRLSYSTTLSWQSSRTKSATPKHRMHLIKQISTHHARPRRSTSIRVIFLAPGKPDEDVSCFLFPCDLDKDRTIDPSVPRPFKSMCVAVASGLNLKDDKRTFMLPTYTRPSRIALRSSLIRNSLRLGERVASHFVPVTKQPLIMA
jgi:hypothetical protein